MLIVADANFAVTCLCYTYSYVIVIPSSARFLIKNYALGFDLMQFLRTPVPLARFLMYCRS